MKVSPVGPSIAFSPTPTTLNLERIERIRHAIISCMHVCTSKVGACEAMLRPADYIYFFNVFIIIICLTYLYI